MTNGIAVGRKDSVARDYWYNGTACSGYSFIGNTTEVCLRNFLNKGNPGFSHWDEEIFKKYSKGFTLAVPEQLIWWGEE